ncbi:diguanylate cyclase [candidate division WOR-3 bacterium]|nr:diguanylate cyclase [candidate division WOR-3 bacterium]
MKLINRRYRVDGEVGKGSYGVIYKVTDLQAGQDNPKILKIFNTDKPGNVNLEEFKNEFFYTKSIDIPCAVKAFDFEKIYNIDGFSFYGNYYFYTMKYIKGENLSSLRFSSRKEKKDLSEKLSLALDWLNKNGFGHGDLHPENVLLDDFSQIVFLDFIQPKDMEIDKDEALDFIEEITGIRPESQKRLYKNINTKSFLENLKKNYEINMGTLKYWRKNIDYALNRSKKAKSKAFRINAVNFKKMYFDIVSEYFKSFAQINEFFFIDLDISKDPLAYFSDFREQLIRSLDIRGIKSSEITKDETMIDGETKAINQIVSSLENLSYYGGVALCVRGKEFALKVSDCLEKIMDDFRGENLLILSEIHSGEFNSPNSHDLTVSPEKDLFADEICRKVENVFSPLDSSTIVDFMRKNGDYDICGILEKVLSAGGGLDKSCKKLLLSPKTRKIISADFKSKFDVIDKFAEEFFSYFDLLVKPVEISLLKYFMSVKDENAFDERTGKLLLSGLIVKEGRGSLNYFDVTTESKIKSIIFGSQINKTAVERVKKYFESQIQSLCFDEEKLLLKLYVMSDDLLHFSQFVFSEFVEPFRTTSDMSKIAGDFFSEFKFPSIFRDFRTEDDFLKEVLEYSAIKLSNRVDASERNRRLNEYLSKKNLSEKTQIYIHFDFLHRYLNAGDIQNSKTSCAYLETKRDKFDKYQDLAFIISKAKYLTLQAKCDESIVLLRSFFKNIKNDPNRKLSYLKMTALEALSECYHKSGELKKYANTLKIYMNKAEEISKKTKETSYLFSSNTNFAFYNFNYGDRQLAKRHFQKALELARKDSDYSDLILACNNLAAIENNSAIMLEYLKDALKYSKLLGENVYIYLVLSNILTLNITPEEKYSFLEQNVSLIKKCYTEHEISVKFCLNIYYSIINILLCLDKQDELLAYYSHLKKTRIQKENMPDAYVFKRIVTTIYEININGYKKEYYKLLYDLINEFRNINDYDLIIYIYINDLFHHIDDKEIYFISKKLINSFSGKTTAEEINSLRVFNRLRSSKIEPCKVIRYIERYVEGISSASYLTYRLIFLLASSYKKEGDPESKNLLSYAASELSRELLQYKNKNLLKKTDTYKILQIFKKEFPSEYKNLFIRKDKIYFGKPDMSELRNQLHINYYSEGKYLLKKIITSLLNALNYDRGAFFSSLHSSHPEIVVHRKRFYYSQDEMYFTDQIPNDRAGEVLCQEILKPNASVKSMVSIPIVNELYYKRYMHHFKKSKKRRTSMSRSTHYEKEFLNGIIYLDKKNDLVTVLDKEYLNLLSFTISQYWNYLNAEKLFMRDGLTKLYLRSVFLNKLRDMIHGEKDRVQKLTLIMIDIDDFKRVNDMLGHSRGDHVLSKLAQIMTKKIRTSDIIGRYGGEEFLIALPNTDIYSGKIVAEKVREAVEKSKILGDIMTLTVSCGVAEYPKDSTWIEELIEKTDKYLLKAKSIGKNSVITSLEENI